MGQNIYSFCFYIIKEWCYFVPDMTNMTNLGTNMTNKGTNMTNLTFAGTNLSIIILLSCFYHLFERKKTKLFTMWAQFEIIELGEKGIKKGGEN